jgi:hypothetical protein
MTAGRPASAGACAPTRLGGHVQWTYWWQGDQIQSRAAARRERRRTVNTNSMIIQPPWRRGTGSWSAPASKAVAWSCAQCSRPVMSMPWGGSSW